MISRRAFLWCAALTGLAAMIGHHLLQSGAGQYIPPVGTGVLSYGTPSTIINDTKVNAFPNLARLANRSLILGYMKGDTFAGDNSDISVRRISSDDGATWGSEVTIASDPSDSVLPGAFGVTSTGRVLHVYDLFHFPTGRPPNPVRVLYSDDNAATWSSPYQLISSFTAVCAHSGSALIQLPNGKILLSVYGSNTGDAHNSAHLFFSTDNGATFGGEVVIANGVADGRDYDEPAIARLPSGKLWCLLRTTSGSPGAIYQCFSTDDGATWSSPSQAFANGYSLTHLRRRYDGTLVAFVRDNTTNEVRAFTSIDAASSWQDQGILDSSTTLQSYYCDSIDRLDGDLLLVYSIQVTSANDADMKQIIATEPHT